jgi:hypothetical protein
MPRKQVLAKKRSADIPYGKLTEDRYTYFIFGFDMDGFHSSWSDEKEAGECWRQNKDRILDRWFRGYRTHYGIRPVGFWQYEKNMKRPDIPEQQRLLRQCGELTEREIFELAKQEIKQSDNVNNDKEINKRPPASVNEKVTTKTKPTVDTEAIN